MRRQESERARACHEMRRATLSSKWSACSSMSSRQPPSHSSVTITNSSASSYVPNMRTHPGCTTRICSLHSLSRLRADLGVSLAFAARLIASATSEPTRVACTTAPKPPSPRMLPRL